MDRDTAAILLSNLLERARIDYEKTFLTSHEIDALEIFLSRQSPQRQSDKPINERKLPSPIVQHISINRDEIPEDAMLCIDFGTSFSKAFACRDSTGSIPEIFDLPLGRHGGSNHLLITPSEMIIDNKNIYFGGHARKIFDDSQASADRLIDSIKQYMTLGADVSNLAKIRVEPAKDPDQKFFQRDILLLYLAHLTRLTEKCLEERGLTINLRRRFAHPAWAGAHRKKNEAEMKLLMAQAIVLGRSLGDGLMESVSVETARTLLDQMKSQEEDLPFDLIAEPVREGTAAGAGALIETGENRREAYLILDVGAGTTDIAGCYCVNRIGWERARVFEITSSADAIPSAGNVLDNALTMLVLDRAKIMPNTAEYRAAAASLARSKRIYKEQLFNSGKLVVEMPTGEVVTITQEEFLNYDPVVKFTAAIKNLIAKSAQAIAGATNRITFIATGGGARLPMLRKIANDGIDTGGKHISFAWREPAPNGMNTVYPDLVEPYPQIAVAVGGALPMLPEQRPSISEGITGAPSHFIAPSYKSEYQ